VAPAALHRRQQPRRAHITTRGVYIMDAFIFNFYIF